ncbi:hypothetical protein SAMN05444166_7630 [Singulisphaera sp. GP187]|nr:hypothetical protein SAMN05444166_7630 [Singulisphaera sp. GP187]
MILLVVEKFEELGSAYAVYRYLVVNDLRLGFRRQRRANRSVKSSSLSAEAGTIGGQAPKLGKAPRPGKAPRLSTARVLGSSLGMAARRLFPLDLSSLPFEAPGHDCLR